MRLPIDHVVVLVADLDAAGAAFESAGFQVTPKTMHSAAMGTANRCIMLHGSYIELMGIAAETPANAPWRGLLAGGAGIRGLALRSDDIRASASELRACGVPREKVRHFSRLTDEGELRFSVTRIDLAATPGLQCLVCQHHTADLLWRPDIMLHANGVRSLRSLILPQADVLGSLPQDASVGGTDIETGSGQLVFSGASARYHDLRAICGVEIEMVIA